jgi:hypothetical protein
MLAQCTDSILGLMQDAKSPENAAWLADSAVIDRVSLQKGVWQVSLIFANKHNPIEYIIRLITSTTHASQAQQIAHYMRRQAARDSRGTITLHADSFHLSKN